jgi:hypothetical protein
MKSNPSAGDRLMKGLLRKRAEIFDQEPVPPGGKYPAADLVTRKGPPLKGYDLKTGINKAFGCCRGSKAGPNNQDIDFFFSFSCCLLCLAEKSQMYNRDIRSQPEGRHVRGSSTATRLTLRPLSMRFAFSTHPAATRSFFPCRLEAPVEKAVR